MEKYSLFHIEGGLGKHIAATAVAKCIKNNHSDRKLIVVCAYPEIFLNLNFVDRVFRIGNTPYFYQDYIKDKDILIFKHEPYFTTEHITKKLPLIENWCKLYNLNYNYETPELVFNVRQQQLAYKKWKKDKPILLLHTNGGPLKEQPYIYSWTRDIPHHISQELVSYYKKDYYIIQICRTEEQKIQGVDEVHFEHMSNSELILSLVYSTKRILIDSSLQHAAMALNLPSTVLWIGTSPKIFGYNIHNNIVANLDDDFKLPDSYLFDYNFNGQVHECPIKDLRSIFDINHIIELTNTN
jgi:hypothetical protein